MSTRLGSGPTAPSGSRRTIETLEGFDLPGVSGHRKAVRPPLTATTCSPSAVRWAQRRTKFRDSTRAEGFTALRSQTRISPLRWTKSRLPPQVTRRLPSRLKEAKNTGWSCTRGPASNWPVAASQSRAVRSFPTVASRLPSGLKTAQFTSRSCGSGRVIGLPVFGSHTRAVQSAAMVTTRLPSGLNAPRRTSALCFMGADTALPSATSQVRATSFWIRSTRRPVGLKAWATP